MTYQDQILDLWFKNYLNFYIIGFFNGAKRSEKQNNKLDNNNNNF